MSLFLKNSVFLKDSIFLKDVKDNTVSTSTKIKFDYKPKTEDKIDKFINKILVPGIIFFAILDAVAIYYLFFK